MSKKQLIRQSKKLERIAKKELARTTQQVERRAKKEWNQLNSQQQTMVVAGAIVQLTLLAAAQIDITRRSPDQIRGSKWMWRIITLVNFIGPIAYFLIGRRKSAPGAVVIDVVPDEAVA
jgi:hypothetical protein